MAYEPCNNPQCPSYGHPHPNCRCYAHGGAVSHKPECPYFAPGGIVHPEHALGHAAIQHGLSGLLKKVGQSDKSTPEEHAQNYLDASVKGEQRLHKHSKSVLGLEKTDPPETRPRKELEDQLDHIRANPESMLNVGGSLGQELPAHSALLSARAAQAVTYLDSIRPTPNQVAPLDKIQKVSPGARQKYDRQLDLAEQPLLLMKHLKSGTLRPQDIATVQTLYPRLYQNMVSKMTERFIETKDKRSIPPHQRRSLGLMLGQPLDFTQTPQAAQAIMAANLGSSKEQSAPQKGGQKRATAAELKEADKWTKIVGTKSQDRELGK